jgi:hypothetical protein
MENFDATLTRLLQEPASPPASPPGPDLAQRYDQASEAYLRARKQFESEIMLESERLSADLNLQVLHDEHTRLWEQLYQVRAGEFAELAAAEAKARLEFACANELLKALKRGGTALHKERRTALWDAQRALAAHERDPEDAAVKQSWQEKAERVLEIKKKLSEMRPVMKERKKAVDQARQRIAIYKNAPKPLSLNLFPQN